MSAATEANPYEFVSETRFQTQEARDTSSRECDDQIVAYGPLSFDDFVHGRRLAYRGTGKIFLAAACCMLVVFTPRLVRSWAGVVNTDFLAILLMTPVVLLLYWRVQKRAYGVTYKSEASVKRWLVDSNGFRIETETGSTFVPYSSIRFRVVSDRAALILSTQFYVVPSTAFTEDDDWQRFVAWLESVESGKATFAKMPSELAENATRNADAIHVLGPMNDAEESCLATAADQRVSFLSRHSLLFVGSTVCALPFSVIACGAPLMVMFYSMPLVCIGLFLLLAHFSKKRIMRLNAYTRWEVSPRGLLVVKDDLEHQTPWAELANLRIVNEGILLDAQQGCFLVPRSGFQTDEDWQLACAMAQSNCRTS